MVVDIEELRSSYSEYQNLCILINRFEEQISKLERIDNNKLRLSILNILEKAKQEDKKYEKEIKFYLSENDSLNKILDLKKNIKYSEDEINEILNNIIYPTNSQVVLLNKDDKEYLVDLNYQEIVDITQEEQDFKEFIIKVLEYHKVFIGKITPADLPLLMALKEQFDVIDENEDAMSEEQENEFQAMEIESNHDIKIEFEKAHNLDQAIANDKSLKPYNINYILDEGVSNEWNKLDSDKLSLTREEYWKRYYYLLVIFANDIEKIYLESKIENNIDKSEFMIDAYISITDDKNYHHMPRTASSIVNCEVLKRKYKVK